MKDIAYQNKDIMQKFSAELLKNKSLAVYGLPDIYIKDLLPTNLPAVEANELRMDNLFVLGDDTLALIDYESSFGKKDVIKYANYIARILKRYESDTGKKFPYLHLIIIFSADIEKINPQVLDIGCMKIWIEPAFLVGIPTKKIYEKLKIKVEKGQHLDDDELLQLIILPLTVKGREEKRKMAEKSVMLADHIADDGQRVQALAGVLTFSDKVINGTFAEQIRRSIRMNKVVKLIYDEGETKGELKHEIFIARKKLAEGMDREDVKMFIRELLETDEEKTNQVVEAVIGHPEASDIEIADILYEAGRRISLED
ncbi:hypothetical protein [Frisingicoccus sp.]